MSRILLIDGSPLFRMGLREIIRSVKPEFSVIEAETLGSGRAQLGGATDVVLVILDIKIEDCGGFVGLCELRSEFPLVPVVVCSTDNSSDTVSRAVTYGAAGYIPKNSPCEVVALMFKTNLSEVGWHGAPLIAREWKNNPIADLSPAQRRVLKGLKNRKANKEIALELGLSEKTIKAYVSLLYRKLGVSGRAQALMLLEKIPPDTGIFEAEAETESGPSAAAKI